MSEPTPTHAERNSKSLERIAESLESIALFLHVLMGGFFMLCGISLLAVAVY